MGQDFGYCCNCNDSFPSNLTDRKRIKTTISIKTPNEIGSNKLISRTKSIKVEYVLSSLYKLDYLNQIQTLDKSQSEQPEEEQEVGVCVRCTNILINLYSNYCEFNHLRRMDSHLNKRIIKLNQLMGKVEELIQSLPKNSTEINKEENLDDHFEHFDDLMESELQNEEENEIDFPDREQNEQVGIKLEVESTSEVSSSESEELEMETSPAKTKTKRRSQKEGSTKTNKLEQIVDGICPICKSSFDDPSKLYKHLLNHFGEQQVELQSKNVCPIPNCTKSSKTIESLRRHLQTHAKNVGYKCPAPNCQIISKMKLKSVHFETHYKEQIFVCGRGKCQQYFTSMDTLKSHWETCFIAKQFTCPACPDQHFIRESRLISHIKAEHRGQKLFPCPKCPQAYGCKSSLANHLLSHDPTIQKCPLNCGKKFTSTEQLDDHRQICAGQPVYTCSICSKSLKDKPAFVIHEKIHKGQIQEIPCPHPGCGKIFYKAKRLRYHMVSHSTIKSFTCEHCGMGFKYRPGLQRHMLLHAKDKPELCNECGKSFARAQGLKRHMKIHSSAREYKCKVCNKDFKFSESLRQHFVTHHQENSFECDICGAGFPYNYTLQRHIESKHGG